jgi:O-antigen/teichoic acid export membrane protein
VTEEGTAARLVRNTLANGAGQIAGVLITLLLTPFLISDLGIEGFGIWALALSFSFLGGYASLTDVGIEVAIARYIAEARSDGDYDAASEVASTGMAFFGLVAAVAAPLLVALSYPLVLAFGIHGDIRPAAVACFAFVGGQLIFELPARVFFATLEGAQRYVTFQAIELLRTALQALLFVVVLVTGLGVAGLGAALMASSLVVLVVATVAARRAVPEVHVRRKHVSRARFRTLLTFGGQYFFVRVMGTLYRQMDKAIVGVALGPRVVTSYEIANRIQQAASMAQSIAASALLPATAFLRRSTEILRELYLRGTNYATAISLAVAGAGFIFATDLIRTWVGESLTHSAAGARLFLVFVAFTAVHAVGSAMIVALGHMRFVIVVTLVFIVVNLVLSVALVGPMGYEGVILGTVIANALVWLPYTLYFLRTFEVRWGEWIRRVALPNVPGLAAQAATAAPLLYLADRSSNLGVVGLLALASALVSLAVFARVGLPADDRARLVVTVRRALGMGDRAVPVGRG